MATIPDWVLDALKQQAPSVLAVLLVGFILGRIILQQHKRQLDDKDKEIERLVKEKNELQKLVLKQRLSTEEPPTSQGPSKPKGKK